MSNYDGTLVSELLVLDLADLRTASQARAALKKFDCLFSVAKIAKRRRSEYTKLSALRHDLRHLRQHFRALQPA